MAIQWEYVAVDTGELEALADRLANFAPAQKDKVLYKTTQDIGNRFQKRVTKQTPVGVYKRKNGATYKMGGTLRRGWRRTRTRKAGDEYKVEVYNDTSYAPYVNYGHRTTSGGWVNGKFFMEKAAESIQADLNDIVSANVDSFLEEVIHGG